MHIMLANKSLVQYYYVLILKKNKKQKKICFDKGCGVGAPYFFEKLYFEIAIGP